MLVLSLFFVERAGERRLLSVAGGLLVLGLGGLRFGCLEATFGCVTDLNAAAYQSLVVWSVAEARFVVGLVSQAPPWFEAKGPVVTLAVFGVLGIAVYEGRTHCRR